MSFCNHDSVAAMKQREEKYFAADVYLIEVFVIHESFLYFLYIINILREFLIPKNDAF